MTWLLILTFAIATGAFVVASAAVLLLMGIANALTGNRRRPVPVRVGGNSP